MNPSQAVIVSGTSVTLECTTTSSGFKTFQIRSGNTVVYTGADNFYNIPSAATSDSGSYVCIVTINGIDSAESSSLILNVYGEYNIPAFLFAIFIIPTDENYQALGELVNTT